MVCSSEYRMPENDPAKFAKSPLLFSALIGTLQAFAQAWFYIFKPSQYLQDQIIAWIACFMFIIPVGIVTIELAFVGAVYSLERLAEILIPEEKRK